MHSLSFTSQLQLRVRAKTYARRVRTHAIIARSCAWIQMYDYAKTFWLKMTCCLCSRSHVARVVAESSSVETAVLPDTGSPEAHHLEEAMLLNQAAKGKRIQWKRKRYWLMHIPALRGKCSPSVIAAFAMALQRPIGIVNTSLRKSCVFFHTGASPLCICCALKLVTKRQLLLLVHKGQGVFVVNQRQNRVNMRALHLGVSQLLV